MGKILHFKRRKKEVFIPTEEGSLAFFVIRLERQRYNFRLIGASVVAIIGGSIGTILFLIARKFL